MHESTAPTLDALRATVDRLSSRATVVADLDGSEYKIFPKALSRSESEAARDWITRERAAQTVEVGLGYGLSTLHICEGLLLSGVPDAGHVAMDPFQRSGFSDCGLQVLGEAGVRHLVEFHPTSSQVLLPQFLDEGRSFDLAFIDGNHRFDYVFVDLFYLGRLVKRGGIVILDDYNLSGIQKAVAFYLTNLQWRIEEVVEDHSVVLRTAEEPDERDFRYFADF